MAFHNTIADYTAGIPSYYITLLPVTDIVLFKAMERNEKGALLRYINDSHWLF